jgi:hypothetical protein
MMENKSDCVIKAPDTYYDVANTEYDRIHTVYDQIDNKAGFLVAVVIGVPIATIGFASQLEAGDLGCVALVLGAIGVLAFLAAGWNIIRALRVGDMKLGVPYDEFLSYSREYEDVGMREWVADILIASSKFNYDKTLEKAKYLQRVQPFLIVEVICLLAAITCVLIGKL